MSMLAWRLRVEEIGAGRDVAFRVPDAALADLATQIGVDRVHAVSVKLRLKPASDGAIDATGAINARLTQTCVVTLEPFESEVVEPLELRFAAGAAAAPTSSKRAPEADDTEDDADGMVEPPEPIVDGVLDLGVVVQEFLALAVDPYPRKPGVSFEPPAAEDAPPSPFAALARLRARPDEGAGD